MAGRCGWVAVLRAALLLLGLVISIGTVPDRAMSQSATPTIIDFRVEGKTLFLEISMNAEAFLAGLRPDTDFSDADEKMVSRYNALRKTVSSELEPMVRDFVKPWMQSLQVQIGSAAQLSYEGVRIPVVGDPQTARISRVLLTAPVPEGAGGMRLTWPAGHGALILRQQQVVAPYTGYLAGGQTSPLIPLNGGAALDARETLKSFFPKGVAWVFSNGVQQVLFVLALVFLSLRLMPYAAQILAFVAGVALAMVLRVMGLQVIGVSTVALAIPAGIVLLAIWNLLASRSGGLRVVAVFVLAMPHGVVLFDGLARIGVPPDRTTQALLAYGGGALLALTALSTLVFVSVAIPTQRSHRLRGRMSVLASMLIAAIGLYWLLAPVVLA